MRRRWALCAALFALACTDDALPIETAPASPPARWVVVHAPEDLTLLELPARAIAAPGSEARLSPPFPARVLRVHVTPGDHVLAGAPLVDVSMPEVLTAAATWTATRARREVRERRRDELESLRADGLVLTGSVFEQEVSLADLDAERARALATLAAAGVSAAQASRVLRTGTVTIASPIEGVVREVDARLGEVRDPAGATLVTIVGLLPVRIEARIARELPEGATLSFAPIDGPVVPLASEPVAQLVDPSDGTRLLWLAPSSEARLPDGLRGRVLVAFPDGAVFEVPTSAIGAADGEPFVLRRTDGDGVERVSVRVLTSSGASALVAGPLAVGDSLSEEVWQLLQPAEAGAP